MLVMELSLSFNLSKLIFIPRVHKNSVKKRMFSICNRLDCSWLQIFWKKKTTFPFGSVFTFNLPGTATTPLLNSNDAN